MLQGLSLSVEMLAELTRVYRLHEELTPDQYLAEMARVLRECNETLLNPRSDRAEHTLALVRAHLCLTFMEALMNQHGVGVGLKARIEGLEHKRSTQP